MNRVTFFSLCIAICVLLRVQISASDFHAYQKLSQAQISTIVRSDSRTTIDLSGTWQVIADGAEIGQTQIPTTESATEGVQLRKHIKINSQVLADRSWSLYFLGVSDEVEIRINGRAAQKYPGGMVPFIVQIPEKILVAGDNTIDVAIAKAGDHTLLSQKFARYSAKRRTGILREVMLIGTPHAWIQDVRTRTSVGGGSAMVNVQTTVRGDNIMRLAELHKGSVTNGKLTIAVEAVLMTSSGVVVARSGMMPSTIEQSRNVTVGSALTVANPSLWSPAAPNLYTLSTRIFVNGTQVDDRSESIGIRTIRVGSFEKGRKIFLNDSAIFIHAIEYVEEYPNVGVSITARQMEHDVSMLKRLGVNVVRLRSGCPHPYLLNLFDRYGILVMVELPAYELPTGILIEDESQAMLRNATERTVSYVENHASVFACGLGVRLEEGVDATNSYFAATAARFRKNSSKLLYKVIPSTLIEKVSEGGFDIIVINIGDAAERAMMNRTMSVAATVLRSSCVIINGGQRISTSNQNGTSDPLSHESQAVTVRETFKTANVYGLGGCMISTFNDYWLDMPTMNVEADNAYICTSGLVDMWRQPRVAFTMYEALINDEKEPLLQARENSAQSPLVFIVSGLVLGLFLVLLVNRSRRFREYLMRALVRPYNFYADIRDQRILSTVQTSLLGIVISSSVGLVLASLLHFSRSNPRVEYITHMILPWPIAYETARFIAWHPAMAVFVCSVGMLVIFAAIATMLRIGAMFIRGKIYWRDTFTIVVWSSLPLVALLPLGIGFYQLLNTDSSTTSLWLSIIVVLVSAWFIVRTLRSTSVVFDVRSSMVYVYGALVLFVVFAVGFWIYSIRFDAADFLQYYTAVINAR